MFKVNLNKILGRRSGSSGDRDHHQDQAPRHKDKEEEDEGQKFPVFCLTFSFFLPLIRKISLSVSLAVSLYQGIISQIKLHHTETNRNMKLNSFSVSIFFSLYLSIKKIFSLCPFSLSVDYRPNQPTRHIDKEE